jgi:hypothetical protein
MRYVLQTLRAILHACLVMLNLFFKSVVDTSKVEKTGLIKSGKTQRVLEEKRRQGKEE